MFIAEIILNGSKQQNKFFRSLKLSAEEEKDFSPPIVWIPEAIRYAQDPESGAEIEQLTSDVVISTNVYCEQRYTSADGARIAIKRSPFGQPTQLWACDMRSLRLCKITEGEPIGSNYARSAVYYVTSFDEGASLMRLDMSDLTIRKMLSFDGKPPVVGAISPDERWFLGGPYPVKDNVYSLQRINLETGEKDTFCEVEDIFNPHTQFEPSEGRKVILQINRGGKTDPKTGKMTLVGPIGATLRIADMETGEISPLPVGRPHTTGITGHSCWAGGSGRLIFTGGIYSVSISAHVAYREPRENEIGKPRSAIYSVAPGDEEARVLAQGHLFNHIAASDDGKFFIADDHVTGRIYVGSLETGRCLGLCESHSRQGACQHGHIHSYMTPDNQFVIFNSIVTGIPQVYAARIPDGFLDAVLCQ
jgi:oligogalacturonide lyase